VKKSNILDSIKTRTTVSVTNNDGDTAAAPSWERAVGTPAWEQPAKISADVQSAKLKQLLGQIKQN
jgi:hypothetical protein